MGGGEIIGVCLFREIERHQGRKARALGHGRFNAGLVGLGICLCDHGWHEIWHDDGAGKMARCFGQNGLRALRRRAGASANHRGG